MRVFLLLLSFLSFYCLKCSHDTIETFTEKDEEVASGFYYSSISKITDVSQKEFWEKKDLVGLASNYQKKQIFSADNPDPFFNKKDHCLDDMVNTDHGAGWEVVRPVGENLQPVSRMWVINEKTGQILAIDIERYPDNSFRSVHYHGVETFGKHAKYVNMDRSSDTFLQQIPKGYEGSGGVYREETHIEFDRDCWEEVYELWRKLGDGKVNRINLLTYLKKIS